MTERDLVHLEYIRESIERIDEYTDGGREDRFKRHPWYRTRCCAGWRRWRMRLTSCPELKERHTEIPWRTVYNFRNVVAHAYTRIDLLRVWEIIRDNLPALRQAVVEELHAIERDGTVPG